ncbi:MAG: hypothetical protein HY271_12550 [Deltaproteobacteria bacterium]|nr:hypothetical protein [Deltaproteobacteria bacterium]
MTVSLPYGVPARNTAPELALPPTDRRPAIVGFLCRSERIAAGAAGRARTLRVSRR